MKINERERVCTKTTGTRTTRTIQLVDRKASMNDGNNNKGSGGSHNTDWETPNFAALMFALHKYKDRFSEQHGLTLNSATREIDVRIIDKWRGKQTLQLNQIAPNGTDHQNNANNADSQNNQIGSDGVAADRIDNAIAHIFETHNLFELKNPGEKLNIDTVWKGISYAAQYKSDGKNDFTGEQGVNVKLMSDITLTFMRVVKPVELFKYMKTLGYRVERKFPGVYYIFGMADIKMQIVVGSELEGDEFVPIRVQNKNASEEDIRKCIEMCEALKKENKPYYMEMARAVMQVSIENNRETYDRILEDIMNALEDLMKDRIAIKERESFDKGVSEGRIEGRNEGRAEGRREERHELLSRLQESGMITADQAATAMGWSF